MNILWNGCTGAAIDQSISTRDVCVVTRQPLLMKLVEMGHTITFTNKPTPPTEDDKIWVRHTVRQELIDLNQSRVEFLDKHIKFLTDFKTQFKPEDYDVAILEARMPLYFHSGTPPDVAIQDKIMQSKLPTILYDKDLWAKYISVPARDNLMIVGPSGKYQVANPKWQGMYRKIDFGIDEDMAKLPSLRGANAVPLSYLGSQYGREPELFRLYAKTSKNIRTKIVGKMYDNVKEQMPNAEFVGRTPIISGKQYLDNCDYTVHLAPSHYSYAGHITYRVWEATSFECALLADGFIEGIEQYVHPKNLVYYSEDVSAIITDEDPKKVRDRQRAFLPKRTFKDVANDFIKAAELIQ